MKGFVFDLDNTLYDRYGTIRMFMEAGADRLMKYINPAYTLEMAIEHACRTEAIYITHKWKDLNAWEGVYGQLVKECFFRYDNVPSFKKFRDFAFHGFSNYACKHPYAETVLKTLKSKGYKLALLTNADDWNYQHSKINRLGIGDYFDEIVVSGKFAMDSCGDATDKRFYKPNAEIFIHTAKLLGVRPSELYYVGDNPNADIIGAINGGYTPVWIISKSPWVLECPMPEHSFYTIEGILSLV